MTATHPESMLTVEVLGNAIHRPPEPFVVKLDAGELMQLLEEAREGHRVYELMLMTRPGDVLEYVWLVPLAVSSRIAKRIAYLREEATLLLAEHPWPEDRVPFVTFDRQFYWPLLDPEDEDAAWLLERRHGTFKRFARELYAKVVVTQDALLAEADVLTQYELRSIQDDTHPFAALDRRTACERGRRRGPVDCGRTDAFFAKLDELLAEPGTRSAAYRGDGDYRIVRSMCREQRVRADAEAIPPGEAFELSTLVNGKSESWAWGGAVLWSDEGIQEGDLRIEDGGLGQPLGDLVRKQLVNGPRRVLLSTRDEGEIPGFAKESGDGWFVYRREK